VLSVLFCVLFVLIVLLFVVVCVECVVLCIVCIDCIVLCIVCMQMCTVLLPPGDNPIAVKYIISYVTIINQILFSQYHSYILS